MLNGSVGQGGQHGPARNCRCAWVAEWREGERDRDSKVVSRLGIEHVWRARSAKPTCLKARRRTRLSEAKDGEPPRNRTENPQKIKRRRRGVSRGSHRVTPRQFLRKYRRGETRSHALDSANCGQNYGQKITSSRRCADGLRRCCGSWRRATAPSSFAGSSTPQETCPVAPTVATPCPLSRRACL